MAETMRVVEQEIFLDTNKNKERAKTSAAAMSRCWQQPHTIAVVGLLASLSITLLAVIVVEAVD